MPPCVYTQVCIASMPPCVPGGYIHPGMPPCVPGGYIHPGMPPYCTLVGIYTPVYAPYCTPLGTPSHHAAHSVHPGTYTPMLAVPGEEALGSNLEKSLGMRRIVLSFSLKCVVRYTSAHRTLCSPGMKERKDWIDEGSFPTGLP